MPNPAVSYTQRPDATPERELSALVAIYKLCISSSHAQEEAAPESRPDDARKDQDARTYSHCT
jgi:hypothetical protein